MFSNVKITSTKRGYINTAKGKRDGLWVNGQLTATEDGSKDEEFKTFIMDHKNSKEVSDILVDVSDGSVVKLTVDNSGYRNITGVEVLEGGAPATGTATPGTKLPAVRAPSRKPIELIRTDSVNAAIKIVGLLLANLEGFSNRKPLEVRKAVFSYADQITKFITDGTEDTNKDAKVPEDTEKDAKVPEDLKDDEKKEPNGDIPF